MKVLKVLCAAFAALLLAGASCPGPGPGPGPTPTPTPTPSTAVRTDMLLRQQNARLYLLDLVTPVNFDQAVQCCGFQDGDEWNSKLPGVENHRWPLISSEAMDFFARYKFNAFHFRMGPFYGDAEHEALWSDIGGPYLPDGSFNQAFFDKVESIVAYAASRGWWVEVVVVDTWYCKHAQWGDQQIPWSPEAVQSCGRVPNAEVEAFIRKTVSTLTRYGNVIWSLDNEGAEIQGAKQEWWNWAYSVVRDEEQKDPSKHVHLVGASFEFASATDFAVTHARAALTEPLVGGKWSLNNERNPQFSVGQEKSNFATARAKGLSYAFWRAEMKEAEMLATLEAFKEVIEGGASVGCFPPAEDDPLWVEPPQAGVVGTNMRPALEEAKAAVGERCGTDHAGSLQTLELLGAELRRRGYCAGLMTDSVFIKTPEGKWQEFHAVTFASGCWSLDPAQLPKNTWTYSGSSAVTCSITPPTVDELLCKEHQATNHVWDCTPKAGGQPILPEGHPEREACERVACGGTPSFELNPNNGLTLFPRENPYQFRVSGSGTASLNCYCSAAGQEDLCRGIEVTQ